MKTNKIKVALLTIALGLSVSAQAAEFVVPSYYTVKLVDGMSSNFDYSKSNRTLTLSEGRHQIVVRFEGNFGTSSQQKFVQATDPIVIEINNMPQDAVYSFSYDKPYSLDTAESFSRNQAITLIDTKNNKNLTNNEASYFILQSEQGFTALRDYRQDLMSLNRLYAPTYVAGTQRGLNMTSYGAPAAVATAQSGNLSGATASEQLAAAVPQTSYSQSKNLATSKIDGTQIKADAVTLNELIKMYDSADNKTKLEFVKYVLSQK